MGGDPIWNATNSEIEALNHWRPEQVCIGGIDAVSPCISH